MRKIIPVVAVATAFLATTGTPASGLAIAVGMTGGISVTSDFGACAYVSAGSPNQLIVGSFTAVGVMQGPGTRLGTVRFSEPILATGSWSRCIFGAYPGATAGDAKYVLHAHTTSGEYLEVKHCTVNRGALTCV